MSIEQQLRDKLTKVEALYFGAATEGEKNAADAAANRLKAKLEEINLKDPPVEMKFSMPDAWAARLFVALCRRYGLRPYRYPRQRQTTIMVCASRQFFQNVVWRQFSDLHTDLWKHFEETTDELIRKVVCTDVTDAENAPLALGMESLD